MKFYRSVLQVLASAMILMAAAPRANAQSPSVFTYQGLLETIDGRATGAYDFRFRMYDAATGGEQVGNEIVLADQSVANGLFSVLLDFATNFDASPRWIEIDVRPTNEGNYETLNPRQPLSPAPQAFFALQAGEAATALNGIPEGYALLGESATPPPGYTWSGQNTGDATHRGEWTPRSDMPFYGSPMIKGAAIEGRFYVVGHGFTGAYDPATDTWETLTPMPTIRNETIAVTQLDGKIYVMAGNFPGNDSGDVYDPQTDSWSPMPALPASMPGSSACTFDGKIYLFGEDRVYNYDPGTEQWSLTATYPEPMTGVQAMPLADKIIVFTATGNTYKLDPSIPLDELPWTELAPRPTERYNFELLNLDDKFYLLGGGTWTFPRNRVEVFDPMLETWSVATPMLNSRTNFAAAVIDGQIYISGGNIAMTNMGQPIRTYQSEMYTPGFSGYYIHVKE